MNDLEQLKLRLVRFPLQTLRSKDARPIVIGELLLAGWKEAVLTEHIDEALAWVRSAAQAEAQKKEVARRLAKKEKKQTTDEAFRSMWLAFGNSLDDLQ